MSDSVQPNLRLVARSVDEPTSDGPPTDATLEALSRLTVDHYGDTPIKDRCNVSWRAKGRPTPGWKGGQYLLQRVEAHLARHDRQLGEHEKRLTATEQRCDTLDARVTDYAYELDILTRISLRNARRLDRHDRRPSVDEKG